MSVSGSASCSGSGTIMLSEAAEKRLRMYCDRARYSRSDFCDNGLGRNVRYVDADLRKIVWNDAEVRGVLLAAGEHHNAWDALVAAFGNERAMALLDLVSAMEL